MKINKNLIIFIPFIGEGGVEKNLFIISNFLAKKFYNVKICTISINKKKKFNKNIKFIGPKKNYFFKLNIRIKYLIALFYLFKFLLKEKNSVVLSFQANVYCVILCKILKIKIIARSNSSPLGWYHNFLKKIFYKKIISYANSVIVNSYEFKKQMEKNFNIKTNCIYNPLDKKKIFEKLKFSKKDNFFRVNKKIVKLVNMGRFTDQKDQITILKASKILKKFIDFRLLIIGKGVEKSKLVKFIDQNQLNENVKIKNFTSNPYGIIKQSDFFILSSKYEGLPNVLLEAAYLKKCIISTNCPTGPKEILLNGKGGLFFKIGNPYDLVKKILYAINNKKIMKQKTMKTYKSLSKYDYNQNLKKYYNLILNVSNENQ